MGQGIRQLYSVILNYDMPVKKLRERAFTGAPVKKFLIQLDKHQ